MKKTFNRLLAATVAIPVALGQVLAISANAAEAPAALKVTADKLLKVEPATGFPETVSADADTITYTVESDWNTTLAKQLNTETSNKTGRKEVCRRHQLRKLLCRTSEEGSKRI